MIVYYAFLLFSAIKTTYYNKISNFLRVFFFLLFLIANLLAMFYLFFISTSEYGQTQRTTGP